MKDIFLGRPVHWLLLIVLIALGWMAGRVHLQVTEFNTFTIALFLIALAAIIIVLLTSPPGARLTRDPLEESEDDDFEIRTQEELISNFSSVSEMMLVLLGSIAAISLVVGGIGIMNIMYVSVTERTREIGLRMAIGGKGNDILRQFLFEAMLLSILGGIIGVGVGFLTSNIVEKALGWPVLVTTHSVVLSFLFCTFIGVFFGWYPARKASALNPIDALRHE